MQRICFGFVQKFMKKERKFSKNLILLQILLHAFIQCFGQTSPSLICELIALCFSLANGEVHVDSYGFRHVFEDTSNGLLLHYLCQELTLHYLMQAGSYEEHQRKWTHFMRLHGKSMANHV